MAIIEAWEPTLPPDSENPTQGANRMREFKRAVEERALQAGMNYPVGAADPDAGKIMAGVQGITGELALAYEADGDVMIQVNDDTAAALAARMIVGTGRGGARSYAFESEALEAATLGLSETITLSIASKVFGDSPYSVGSESILLADVTAGGMTVNLPAAVAGNVGRLLFIRVRGTSANAVIVSADGSDQIRYVRRTGGETTVGGITMQNGPPTGSNPDGQVLLIASEVGVWDAFFYRGS